MPFVPQALTGIGPTAYLGPVTAKQGVVQKVLFPGYTRSGQSRARQGFPSLECYPGLNHASWRQCRA
jgi:hypothetical protein